MRNEISVEPNELGVYARKKGGSKKYHFFPFANGELDVLPNIPSCACGYYLFDSKEFETISGTKGIEDDLHKECHRRAVVMAEKAEADQVEATKTQLREIGAELRGIVDSSIDIAVLLCDAELLDMMVNAYKLVDGARFATLSEELGLRKHFAEIMIAKSNGNQDRVMELLEMAMEGRWL